MSQKRTEMTVVVTFEITTLALKTEGRCKKHQIAGRLIPIPRQLSAGCGMAWSSPIDEKQKLITMLADEEIEVNGIYEIPM